MKTRDRRFPVRLLLALWMGVMSLLALGLAVWLLPGKALAAEAQDEPRLEARAGTIVSEQLSGNHGQYNLNLMAASLSYQIFRLSYEERQYDWDQDKLKRLPFGNGRDDPWKQLRHLELSAGKELKLNENWGMFLEAGALAAYEKKFGGLGGRLRGWAGYALGPDLRLRLGGRVYGYQAGLAVLIPELALDYNQAKSEGFSASIGVPDAYLRYGLCPWAGLRLAGWLDRDLYRLDEHSPVRPDGYLESRRYQSGLFLDLRPLPGLEASLGLTRSWGGVMTTYDKDADHAKEYDLDGAWGGLLTLSYCF